MLDPQIVGGVWFAIFFVNFLIEEYNINLRLLMIAFSCTGFLLLWLHLLGWVMGFLGLFQHLAFSISGTGYLLIAVIGALTVVVSWLHGLFYYVAITPNNLDIQTGPAEAGEQIGREDYSTKIDTGDFLERLLGFGHIIVIFKDRSRPPINLLVWRVDQKAQMLETVRAKLTVDHPQEVLAQEPVPAPCPPAPPTPPQSEPPEPTVR